MAELSDSESVSKKSVYMVDNEKDEDEWAAIVKFDSELHK